MSIDVSNASYSNERIAKEDPQGLGVRIRNYPGEIPRQELVDYCVSLANKQRQELIREQDILEKNEKTMSDDQYETLVLSQATLMGSINALRDVTEWARRRVEAAREH